MQFHAGEFENGAMKLKMKPGSDNAMHRLTFFKISDKEVRQLGEISKDNGASWQAEYDLMYRR